MAHANSQLDRDLRQRSDIPLAVKLQALSGRSYMKLGYKLIAEAYSPR
jgi:hypothetical protein